MSAGDLHVTQLDDLACQYLVELVTDYIEGALDHATKARFERHLLGCPFCSIYVQQIRDTIRLVGKAAPPCLGDEAKQELLEAFRSWHGLDR